MKVYVSVDMEGLAGVSHNKPTSRGDDGYPQAVELMVGETNAAIEGAFDGGATDVTVNDSHGGMFNLPPEKLDTRARLVQGNKPYTMAEAAREGAFDVALFVGYHARAGHPRGTLAHTYTGRITLVELGGRPAPEAAINALYLGALGVPVGLVSGDDALAEEVTDWLPWAERVVVKRAVSMKAADSLHPSVARGLIRESCRRVVEKLAGGEHHLQPLVLDGPISLRIDFAHAGFADMAAMIPGFDRQGDRGVHFQSDDATTVFRAFVSAADVSRAADD
ncbi:M55 family metallopeptidase [soil metagenome]